MAIQSLNCSPKPESLHFDPIVQRQHLLQIRMHEVTSLAIDIILWFRISIYKLIRTIRELEH